MSSAQDGTFSPRNLAILGGLLFFGLFLGEVVFPRQGGIFSQAEKQQTTQNRQITR